MKYSCEILVQLPCEQLIRLFDDPQTMSHWMPTLQGFTLLKGLAGQPGACAALLLDQGSQPLKMLESIEEHPAPYERIRVYHTDGMSKRVHYRFQRIGARKTRILVETDLRLLGFLRLFSFFLSSTYPQETKTLLTRFKAFAEEKHRADDRAAAHATRMLLASF